MIPQSFEVPVQDGRKHYPPKCHGEPMIPVSGIGTLEEVHRCTRCKWEIPVFWGDL